MVVNPADRYSSAMSWDTVVGRGGYKKKVLSGLSIHLSAKNLAWN